MKQPPNGENYCVWGKMYLWCIPLFVLSFKDTFLVAVYYIGFFSNFWGLAMPANWDDV